MPLPPKVQANIIVETDTSKLTIATGGSMSSRIPVNFVAPNGETVKGFFTKHTLNSSVQDRFNAIIAAKKAEMSGHPEYQQFFEAIEGVSSDKIFKNVLESGHDHNLRFANPRSQGYTRAEVIRNWSKCVNSRAFTEYLESKRGNAEFEQMLFDISKKFMNEYSAEYTTRKSGQARDVNINRRNNAMYEVAELLGYKDLIAQSCNMTLLGDGNATRGTFMFNAKGYDLDQLNPYTNRELAGRKMKITPEACKTIADLQVIDYICGNVDRHTGNFFYQFDLSKSGQMRLIGVQGIDNDMSFVNTDINTNKRHFADVMQFGKVSTPMATALLEMKKEDFETIMRNAGVSEAELQTALGRLDKLRKGIESRKIETIDDDEWSRESNDISELRRTGMTFAKAAGIMDQWNDIVLRASQQQLMQIAPDRFKTPKPVEVGMTKTEIDKFNLLENAFRLKEIKTSLNAKTPASHENGPEFKKMISALDKVFNLATRMASEVGGPSDKQYNELSEAYEALGKRSQDYLDSHKGMRRSMGKFRVEKANELKTLAETCRHSALENSIEAFNEQMKAEALFIKNGGRQAAINKLAEQVADPFSDIAKIEKNSGKQISKLEANYNKSRQKDIKDSLQKQIEQVKKSADAQKRMKFCKMLATRLSAEKINTADTMNAKLANFYSNPDVINQAARNIYNSKEFKNWADKEFTQEYINKLKAKPEKLGKEADKMLGTLGIKPESTIEKARKSLKNEAPEIKVEVKGNNSLML